MLHSQDFKNISIRGRMAFSLLCLENALNHLNFKQPGWEIVITKLWKFNTERYLDDWFYGACEIETNSILEELEFSKKEMEHLTVEEYCIIRELYKNSNKTIGDIISNIFRLGSIEMYGAVIGHSPYTLGYLQTIIDILNTNSIELPLVKPFEKFEFLDGFGKRFSRDLSFITEY